ncbi:hypothetical protein PUMCH_000924 [Australozyma saopauloensis]|uniref:Protein kinase domain-containing protein n=1 Tax=Australozyma saopauloensis TaxID=291208 RepID=A0AAX4H6S6_9ASCO|nr:hypothetical protein PUMCH_000924 [[Candida] saopauloensis]
MSDWPETPNTSSATFQLELAPSLPLHYELGPVLGEGAFSSVYRAKNTKTGQDVAIKIINKLNLSQKQLANISNEIHVMNTLANAGPHPNILRLIEAFDTDLNCFIVLELCDGGEIFNKIIEYTYFSELLSRHVFYQLLDAIRYMHENHIVHRDIKPENLLFKTIPFNVRSEEDAKAALRASDDESKVDEGKFVPGVGGGCIGAIKLADFGLAKQLKYDLLSTKRANNLKTPCGTAGYTAPEVIHCGVDTKKRFKSSTSRSNYYSKAVDIWSLGCFLYTILCGFPPFYDEDHVVLTQKIIKADFVFLEPWWDEVSAEAKDLITRMLIVNPEDRITIEEIYAHPWVAKATAPEAKEYFPDNINFATAHTPQSSRSVSASPYRNPSTPNGLMRALVSPGIAIKQVFNNPAMSHVNLKLLAQLQQRDTEIHFDENTKFKDGSLHTKIPQTPAPKDISFRDVLANKGHFSFSDDDDDDEDEDDEGNDYSDGSFFGDESDDDGKVELIARFKELDMTPDESQVFAGEQAGTPTRSKYISLSSNSSTDSLKLTYNEDGSVLRSSSVMSNGASDMKFTLNLNDLNLLKRRTSVKSTSQA